MHGHYGPPIGSRPPGVEWSRDRRCHVTPKDQGCDQIIFEAPYHRLNESSSTVLTATSLFYGEAKNLTSHRTKTLDRIKIKFGAVDCIGEGTRHANFYANPSKPKNGWNIQTKFYLYMPFFLQRTHRSDPLRDFYA